MYISQKDCPVNGVDTVNKSRTFYGRLIGLPEGNRA